MSNANLTPSEARRASRSESERPAAPRERTRNLGGPRLKMAVLGTIDGFHLYWENDDDGAIEQLLHEGFEFVKPSEVRMTSHIVVDGDIADRVSRFVGKKADGSPMRAYLLKCSEEHWADRESDRYEQADQWDNAIRAGRVQADTGRYIPKGHDISLNSQFRKAY